MTHYPNEDEQDLDYWRDRALAAEDYADNAAVLAAEYKAGMKELERRLDAAHKQLRQMQTDFDRHMERAHPEPRWVATY